MYVIFLIGGASDQPQGKYYVQYILYIQIFTVNCFLYRLVIVLKTTTDNISVM